MNQSSTSTAAPFAPDHSVVRLETKHLSKTYGSGANAKPIIGDLNLQIFNQEVVCLVGRSGIGKTTLLKCVCGLMAPSSGEALLDGEVITGPPKKLAVVFQEYTRSLMPWLSVEKNILLPVRGTAPREELADRCAVALREVGLVDAAQKYPWQLSGGMQQRVAIARALAYQPEVLLMDEPFASVDAQTRFDLEDLVLRLRAELGITIILVTHDIDEAVYLSDRVIVLGGAPATVNQVIPVDLPHPRNQIDTRNTAVFAETRTTVLELIQEDVRARLK